MVTIKGNHVSPKELAYGFSEHVKSIVEEAIWPDEPEWNIYVSMSVYDLLESYSLSERKIKTVALMIFGSDWGSIVHKLKELKILAEGFCPQCGEELIEMFKQTLEATYTNPAEGIEYLECPKCSYSDYNERI